MKKIIFILIPFLFACNNDKARIQKFEEHFGTEQSTVLTELVLEFEAQLKTFYGTNDLKKAYYDYFNDNKNEHFNFYKEFYDTYREKIIDVLKQAKIDEEIVKRPIDVEYENGKFLKHYVYDADTFQEEHLIIVPEIKNIDSVLQIEKKSVEFNMYSKYFQALNLIKEDDSTIIKYLDAKDAIGFIPPSIFANAFLFDKVDIEDYFIKRIVFTEFYY